MQWGRVAERHIYSTTILESSGAPLNSPFEPLLGILFLE
jgi:hypothetical protein